MKTRAFIYKLKSKNFFIQYWGAIPSLCIATFVGHLLAWLPDSYTGSNFTNIGMIYLVATVFSAVSWGIFQSLFTAIIGFLLYQIIFRETDYNMDETQAYEFINLLVFIAASFVAAFIGSSSKNKLDKERLENALQKERQNLDREELRSALLSSVTHDLKTPLASVIGSLSSVIQVKALSDKAKNKLINTAYEESVRLNDFISNILNMTKLESGAAEINKECCNPIDIINISVKRLSERLKGRRVIVNKPDFSIEVNVDILLVEHVMQNLLDNAIKYSAPKSEIIINIEENGVISFTNKGLGILEEDVDKIFDKFHRSSKQDSSIAGTGLGLAICKAIMDIHGGTIMLTQSDSADKYSNICFSLQFPEIKQVQKQ